MCAQLLLLALPLLCAPIAVVGQPWDCWTHYNKSNEYQNAAIDTTGAAAAARMTMAVRMIDSAQSCHNLCCNNRDSGRE